jgi:SAM-dependent methyltransferase
MLEEARARTRRAGVTNAHFEEADAQVWRHPASFDVAISRFGVMFFDDPVAAFSNVANTLTAEGRLVFVCWQELAKNEWLLVPGIAAAAHVSLPELGPANAPGMFALADPSRISALLDASGFRSVDVTPFETEMLLAGGGTIDETVEFLLDTGIARTLLGHATPDAAARAVDAVRDVYAQHCDDEGVRLGAAAWVATATK